MIRIKIKDLPRDMKISRNEMHSTVGGLLWSCTFSDIGFKPSYSLSPTTGEVLFGDGLPGSVPPTGTKTRAKYRE